MRLWVCPSASSNAASMVVAGALLDVAVAVAGPSVLLLAGVWLVHRSGGFGWFWVLARLALVLVLVLVFSVNIVIGGSCVVAVAVSGLGLGFGLGFWCCPGWLRWVWTMVVASGSSGVVVLVVVEGGGGLGRW